MSNTGRCQTLGDVKHWEMSCKTLGDVKHWEMSCQTLGDVQHWEMSCPTPGDVQHREMSNTGRCPTHSSCRCNRLTARRLISDARQALFNCSPVSTCPRRHVTPRPFDVVKPSAALSLKSGGYGRDGCRGGSEFVCGEC